MNSTNNTHSSCIQQRVFTNYINAFLSRKYQTEIQDLVTGLADGNHLIHLIQELSRYYKDSSVEFEHPIEQDARIRVKMLTNVQLVINYLRRVDGLILTGVSSEHIVDGNLKMILGLIWSVLFHYQISGDARRNSKQKPRSRHIRTASTIETAEIDLLSWINHKLKDKHRSVSNFNHDWVSGEALAALVSSLGSSVSIDTANRTAEDTITSCLDVASQSLGVPKIVSATDFSNDLDPICIMLYLSLFRNNPFEKIPEQSTEQEQVLVKEQQEQAETNLEISHSAPLVEITQPLVESMTDDIEPVLEPEVTTPLIQGSTTQKKNKKYWMGGAVGISAFMTIIYTVFCGNYELAAFFGPYDSRCCCCF